MYYLLLGIQLRPECEFHFTSHKSNYSAILHNSNVDSEEEKKANALWIEKTDKMKIAIAEEIYSNGHKRRGKEKGKVGGENESEITINTQMGKNKRHFTDYFTIQSTFQRKNENMKQMSGFFIKM